MAHHVDYVMDVQDMKVTLTVRHEYDDFGQHRLMTNAISFTQGLTGEVKNIQLQDVGSWAIVGEWAPYDGMASLTLGSVHLVAFSDYHTEDVWVTSPLKRKDG